MVDIERSNYRKGTKGINLLNSLFKKRSKRNLNEIVRCLSGSNDKLDQLLSKSMNNMNEMNGGTTEVDSNQNNQNNHNYNFNNLKSDKRELLNYDDERRRLSTPIMVPMENLDQRKEPFTCKKLSLKMRRSFSPKTKLIINQSQKKMSLDQELLEHYNQLSTECNQSYMSLVSNSPISPRIKSIDDDIEAITLSRQDNPYIQSKLEMLSHYTGIDHDILSISNLSLNNAAPFVNYSTSNLNQSNNSSHSNQSTHSNQFSHSNKTPSISSEELDEILNCSNKSKEDNLHQHLIRSPPPHFPLDFSSFVYPPIGSPLRSLTEKYNNSTNSDTASIKTPNLFLSPLKTPKSSRLSNPSSKEQNLFFSNLPKNKLKNFNKSNDSQLSTNENDVELIITS